MFYIIFATYYNVFYIMYCMGFITIIYYYYKTHIIMYFILCIVCVSKVKNLHNDAKIQSCDSIFSKWLQKYAKNRFKSLTDKNNLKLIYSVEDYL